MRQAQVSVAAALGGMLSRSTAKGTEGLDPPGSSFVFKVIAKSLLHF